MGQLLKFNQQGIEDAEAYYNKIHLADNQKVVLDSIAKIIVKYLPNVSEMAIKGFAWRGAIEWQQENKREMGSVEPHERLSVLVDLFRLLKKGLTRILIDKEHESLLDKAIEDRIEFYKHNLVNRYFFNYFNLFFIYFTQLLSG